MDFVSQRLRDPLRTALAAEPGLLHGACSATNAHFSGQASVSTFASRRVRRIDASDEGFAHRGRAELTIELARG
jgi:hypothetical protein